jgi:hypothetical protein
VGHQRAPTHIKVPKARGGEIQHDTFRSEECDEKTSFSVLKSDRVLARQKNSTIERWHLDTGE